MSSDTIGPLPRGVLSLDGYGCPVTTPEAPPPPRSFWRVALTARMIGLLIAFLAAAAVCGALGAWQLDRAHERAQLSALHERAEAESAVPMELGEVVLPQAAFSGNAVGQSVTLAGTYEPDHELYVPGRTVEGRTGYLVLTGLRVSDDGSGGASWADLSGEPLLPIVRGWVATIPAPGTLPPPAGLVEMTVYLQASEAGGTAPTADDTIEMISAAQLLPEWGGPIYGAYGVLVHSTPPDGPGLVAVSRPTIEGGDELNIQNLFYALEWWIFGGFAVALWIKMVRDESRGGVDPLAVPEPV